MAAEKDKALMDDMKLIKRIADAMADGRWRTVDDIRRKVPSAPDDIRAAMTAMLKRKMVKLDYGAGDQRMPMWKSVQQEGVQ
jgi:hypothetical protein